LNREKCHALSELDKILTGVAKTQAKLLSVQSDQQKQEFLVKDHKEREAKRQQQLTLATKEYNELCCQYKTTKRNVSDVEKSNAKLCAEINNKKEEVKNFVKGNVEVERKIKSINRKLQERLQVNTGICNRRCK